MSNVSLFLRAAIFVSLSMLYCGQARAQVSCYFSNSPECKFLAICKANPGAASPLSSECSCAWEQVKQGLPESEHTAYVELMGAIIPPEDKTRAALIMSRMGDAFIKRVDMVQRATRSKCDKR